MDLRCVLAAAVVLAAAEKEYTTAKAQNIKFGSKTSKDLPG